MKSSKRRPAASAAARTAGRQPPEETAARAQTAIARIKENFPGSFGIYWEGLSVFNYSGPFGSRELARERAAVIAEHMGYAVQIVEDLDE